MQADASSVFFVQNRYAQRRPNFFIVGAPKCGTTALNQYLSAHPDVYLVKKEMHFFGADLRFGPRFYRRDHEAYLEEFDAWNGQSCVGEASVWYLFSRNAAAEIKAFNSDARIIIMLREPTAMLYSLYSAFCADGNENLPTFEQALAAERERKAGNRVSRQAYLAQALNYRAIACFSEQVRRYFEVFGRERVKVIVYDDFSTDTNGVYRQTLDFLGVAVPRVIPDFVVVNGNANGNASVRSPALRAVLSDPLVRGTAIALRHRLPRSIFKFVQTIGLRLETFNFVDSPKKRVPLPPELCRSLQREFMPEVERLSALLGRDLTHWCNTETAIPEPPPVPERNRDMICTGAWS